MFPQAMQILFHTFESFLRRSTLGTYTTVLPLIVLSTAHETDIVVETIKLLWYLRLNKPFYLYR